MRAGVACSAAGRHLGCRTRTSAWLLGAGRVQDQCERAAPIQQGLGPAAQGRAVGANRGLGAHTHWNCRGRKRMPKVQRKRQKGESGKANRCSC